VIAGIITPFAANGSVAWEELQDETELLSRSPVDGLCVGTFMSETEGSAPEEMFRLCQAVSGHAQKPVVAMISPDSQQEASELVQAVESGGVQSIIVAQPHYLCQPGLEGLAKMFAALREETRLPLVLANCQRSAMIPVETMHQLVLEKLIDGIVVGGDGTHVMVDLLCLHLDVPVFSAMEDLHYVGLLMGAQGIVSDLAAVFPDEVARMYRAHCDGKRNDARSHHERLVRLWRVLEHPSEQRARVRSALMTRGRNVGEPRSPYNVCEAGVMAEVRSALEREGLAS
jgi:4-hydroxy-tetrahydrodipicolinate synthase